MSTSLSLAVSSYTPIISCFLDLSIGSFGWTDSGYSTQGLGPRYYAGSPLGDTIGRMPIDKPCGGMRHAITVSLLKVSTYLLDAASPVFPSHCTTFPLASFRSNVSILPPFGLLALLALLPFDVSRRHGLTRARLEHMQGGHRIARTCSNPSL